MEGELVSLLIDLRLVERPGLEGVVDRVVDPDLGHVQVDVGALLRPHGGDVVDLEAEPLDLSQERQLVLGVGNLSIGQVWSLTQFHSFNFFPSRKKCYENVCVFCQ